MSKTSQPFHNVLHIRMQVGTRTVGLSEFLKTKCDGGIQHIISLSAEVFSEQVSEKLFHVPCM